MRKRERETDPSLRPPHSLLFVWQERAAKAVTQKKRLILQRATPLSLTYEKKVTGECDMYKDFLYVRPSLDMR